MLRLLLPQIIANNTNRWEFRLSLQLELKLIASS